jgi:hypothetical protein
MPFDLSCRLWPDHTKRFFAGKALRPLKQRGPHCVSTTLAMLTGAEPECFQGRVNTQDPASWSEALREWGMKLAYCPTDVRRLRFYLPELLALDDLFTLSYYTPGRGRSILANPDADGWVCGSHIVILHRDRIFDPQSGDVTAARDHGCLHLHTKRIFRVVPADHPRGL